MRSRAGKHYPLRTLIAIAVLVGTAACTDRGVPATEPTPPPVDALRSHGPSDQLEARTYWRSADTLWVYDMKPEVGIGTHFGDQLSIGQIDDLGMRIMRYTLYIHEYHETPNCASNFHSFIASACSQGIVPMVVVHAGEAPQYVGTANPNYDWFATFMGTVAGQLPCVRYWQLWNEVEVDFPGSAVFGSGTPYDKGWNYAQMLKKAYPAIKAANPNAWVLTSGMVSVAPTWPFLEGIYAGGGRQYFDILAMHSYGAVAQWDAAPTNELGVSGDGLRSRAERYRLVMSQNGDTNRPLWVTEFGTSAMQYHNAWGLPPAPHGLSYDTYRRDWWKDAMDIQDATRYVQKMMGYQLYDVTGGAPPGANVVQPLDYTHGLLRYDRVTPDSTYRYFQRRGVNAHVFAHPLASGNVTVSAPGRRPVGYAYTRSGSAVTFWVTVNKLHPTVVVWEDEPIFHEPPDPQW